MKNLLLCLIIFTFAFQLCLSATAAPAAQDIKIDSRATDSVNQIDGAKIFKGCRYFLWKCTDYFNGCGKLGRLHFNLKIYNFTNQVILLYY